MTKKLVKPILQLLPVMLNVNKKRCIIIGGGEVALRKTRVILGAGGRVQVISPRICNGLKDMEARGRIRVSQRKYRQGDIKNAYLVLIATSSKDTNVKVSQEAKESRILINVADGPVLSNFIFPSSFKRGSLVFSVSTSGKSPAMARIIRKEIERQFGLEFKTLTDIVGEVRKVMLEKGIRLSFQQWHSVLDLMKLASIVKNQGRSTAKTEITRRILSARKITGTRYL